MTIEPISPPAVIPSRPNRKPPTRAPMIPTTMFPRTPNPLPFMIFPAAQPATAPTTSHMIKPVMSMMSSCPGSFHEKVEADDETDGPPMRHGLLRRFYARPGQPLYFPAALAPAIFPNTAPFVSPLPPG